MRPIAKEAASDSAKIAALLPMPVPITARVSGCRAAMKMMNGIGLKKLITTFRIVKIVLLGSRRPALVE